MMFDSLGGIELHLCNLVLACRNTPGERSRWIMSDAARATEPELDEALARAIRQLIAEAMEAGGGGSRCACGGAPGGRRRARGAGGSRRVPAPARPGGSPGGAVPCFTRPC